MTDDSHTHAHPDLPSVLAASWAALQQGVTNRTSAFHHASLASIDAQGKPRLRTVIMRHVDPLAQTVRFHTDVRSPKWRELHARPQVGVLLYDTQEKLQIRMDGRVSLHHQDEASATAWTTTQPMSRIAYGSEPGPGQPIPNLQAFSLPKQDDAAAIAAGEANFGVILVHVTHLEWLSLRQRGNRRALFDFTAGTAQWLAP